MKRFLLLIIAIYPAFYIPAANGFFITNGFFDQNNPLDSANMIPPPPIETGHIFQNDIHMYQEGLKLRFSPRGKRAIYEANLSTESISKIFSKALGKEITPKNTPHTTEIIDKLAKDSCVYAVKTAKEKYNRLRPFTYFKNPSCTPDIDNELSKNGSYPSAHAAAGWIISLVLSEIKPERRNQLLKQGYEFGQSRVICGVHWQSDVEAGRLLASILFSELHSNKLFSKVILNAKKELGAN